jgi:hypothetical protein
MKSWMAVLVAMGVSVGTVSAQLPTYEEVSPDLGVDLQVAMPGVGDYDLFEYGLTAELQFRDMVSAPWGYLLAIGYGEWASDSGANSPGSNLYDFDGNLEVIPFGGSVLFQAYQSDACNIILDAGIRYLSTVSQITARNSDSSPDQRFEIDADDGIVYRFGVGADYAISPDFIWSAGLAYQADIEKAEISTSLGPARDLVMEAFIFSTALRLPF